MSEETSGKESAEEIRLRQRRAFDAFNEAQAKQRNMNRAHSAAQVAEENRRWVKREVDTNGTGDTTENDAPGG
jgi:hypothetical protein